MDVGRYARSPNAYAWHAPRWPPEPERKRLEVLRDCGEVEPVTSAREHSFEVMMGLEVSKSYLDLLSLIA